MWDGVACTMGYVGNILHYYGDKNVAFFHCLVASSDALCAVVLRERPSCASGNSQALNVWCVLVRRASVTELLWADR